MSLHPAYDALFGKHRIRFFADKRQWKDNCLECGGKDTLFVRYDDDVAEFRCDACGRNGSERLRPPSAPTDGGNGAPPRDDAEYQRPLEEAQRALDAEPEPENLEEAFEEEFPEDDDEQEPAPESQGADSALKTEPEPEPEHKASIIEEATALRRKLVAAGYLPIPLYGKEPPIYGNNNHRKGLAGWQTLTSVTDEMIVMWAKTWPDAVNTGILTRNVPALDLDILNEEAVRACEDLVRDRYEDAGVFLVRIGQPPKRAILFRTDEPFKKFSVNQIARNAAPDAKPEKIEMLGDGEQVVVAGIHPDTKRPYRWHGGEPWAIKREDLPYNREAEARGLVDDLLAVLTSHYGYTARTRPGKPGGETGGNGRDRGAGAEDWQYLSRTSSPDASYTTACAISPPR